MSVYGLSTNYLGRKNNHNNPLGGGSAQGNWDPRKGQQLFRPNLNGGRGPHYHVEAAVDWCSKSIMSQTLLGVTFDRTLSFSKHVSLLKAKFFLRLKALRCISAFSWGPSKESLSLLYKAFLRPLLTYASPGWFPFLSATNITKLERFHRAASRAISGCLSFSPIPLLLSEALVPPLRVTLTHFALSSYERALRLPNSLPISGLVRLTVKPRPCRSSWRAFASTHPLMLHCTSPREALFACPPSPSWNLPSFTVESTLSSPFSRSDPPLFPICLLPLGIKKVLSN